MSSQTGIITYSAGTTDPLNCLVVANPAPTAYWWTVDGTVVDPAQVSLEMISFSWFVLTYSPSKPWDSTGGTAVLYRCSVENSVGTGFADLQLVILGKKEESFVA